LAARISAIETVFSQVLKPAGGDSDGFAAKTKKASPRR
jgi:hypothetical protein